MNIPDPVLATTTDFKLYSTQNDLSLYVVACLLSGFEPERTFNELWGELLKRDPEFSNVLARAQPQDRIQTIFQPWKLGEKFETAWEQLTLTLGTNNPLLFQNRKQGGDTLTHAHIPLPDWLQATLDRPFSSPPTVRKTRITESAAEHERWRVCGREIQRERHLAKKRSLNRCGLAREVIDRLGLRHSIETVRKKL